MNKTLLLFLKICTAIILIIICCEFVLRLLGFEPYQKPTESRIISSSPILEKDKLLGYNNAPGIHSIILNQQLEYTSTIENDFSRKCIEKSDTSTSPMIAITGCSFFAGMGVSDTAVLSNQLQKELSSYKIKNWSIPGHGLTSQYLILKNLVSKNTIPRIMVFEMASFHLLRNVGSDQFLFSFQNIKKAPLEYPYCLIQKDKNVIFGLRSSQIIIPNIIQYSSIANILFKFKLEKEFTEEDLLQVQAELINRIEELCKNHQITPIFMMIDHDEISKETIKYLKSKSLAWINSQVDYKNSAYNLSPADGHPNNDAHQIYAHEIFQYLKENNL